MLQCASLQDASEDGSIAGETATTAATNEESCLLWCQMMEACLVPHFVAGAPVNFPNLH